MTSLGEVYGGGRRVVDTPRRYAGIGLFAVGAALLVAGIVVATTDLLRGGATTLYDVREWGGILAGVGVPLVFLGILTVVPADRTTRAAAVIGAAVSFLGVGLFTHAYPCRWSGASCASGLPNLTLPTAALYFSGAIVTFWCLFVGVANFKRRNDPGGTVRMEVTRQGETRVVEVERSRMGVGGVGLLGSTPDGEVGTQTNRSGGATPAAAGDLSPTASDGGSTTKTISSPLDGPDPTGTVQKSEGSTRPTGGGRRAGTTATEAVDGPVPDSRERDGGVGEGADDVTPPADRYCGNCAQFDYVRTDRGIQPYCAHHDELMDDMEACDHWEPTLE